MYKLSNKGQALALTLTHKLGTYKKK